MNRLVTQLRHLVVVPIIGLIITMSVTFLWAIAKTVRLIDALLDGGWRGDLLMIDLLEVIDTHLIALVQLIVVVGLYELFIGQLDVPAWLKARSLEDLKKSIIDVLVVFIAVKGIERLVSDQEPIDALTYTGAVAILVVALTLFRLKPTRYEGATEAVSSTNPADPDNPQT